MEQALHAHLLGWITSSSISHIYSYPGISFGMDWANERRHYNVTSSLIGSAHTHIETELSHESALELYALCVFYIPRLATVKFQVSSGA